MLYEVVKRFPVEDGGLERALPVSAMVDRPDPSASIWSFKRRPGYCIICKNI